MALTIRIIRPSSRESGNLMLDRFADFKTQGFTVLYDEVLPDPSWPYAAASVQKRASVLAAAILEKESSIVWSARGGYGASDLLPLLPWDDFKAVKEKPLLGFSDFCAIASAVYTKLGWSPLHAPMPATTLWGQNGDEDLQMVWRLLRREAPSIKIPLDPSARTAGLPITGRLFGGCFSVLTNLIGTPFFPSSLKDHILFFEDTGENPGRCVRFLNQWKQSSALDGVKAIVLGHFREHEEATAPGTRTLLMQEFSKRVNIPIFGSKFFGHTSPNFPLALGAAAEIHSGQLIWTFANKEPGRALA